MDCTTIDLLPRISDRENLTNRCVRPAINGFLRDLFTTHNIEPLRAALYRMSFFLKLDLQS